MDEYKCSGDTTLVDISKVNSYISNRVLEALKELIKNPILRIVPVTTRSIAEYKRINIPDIEFEYAITSNGGTILKNGEILETWRDRIKENTDTRELEHIAKKVDRIKGINYKSRVVDESFIFSKTDDLDTTVDGLSKLGEIYRDYSFETYKHKVYIIPKFITKSNALLYLEEILNERVVFSSGDGYFDLPMLKQCDVPIVPSHSKITTEDLNNITFVDGLIDSPLETFNIIKRYIQE